MNPNPIPMAYEWNAVTPAQALDDLRVAALRVREYAAAHPGARLVCQIRLDLPKPPAQPPTV